METIGRSMKKVGWDLECRVWSLRLRVLGCGPWVMGLPRGPIVVPFWEYLFGFKI